MSTLHATEQLAVFQQKLLIDEVLPTVVAAETVRTRVPVVFAVRQAWGVRCNQLTTSTAHLAIQPVEALDTVGIVLVSYVSETRQRGITEPTTEVLHVPRLVLRLRVLTCEDDLIARGAPWVHQFRVMSAAINVATAKEVNVVHKEFLTLSTGEAPRVEAKFGPHSVRDHGKSTGIYRQFASVTPRQADFRYGSYTTDPYGFVLAFLCKLLKLLKLFF